MEETNEYEYAVQSQPRRYALMGPRRPPLPPARSSADHRRWRWRLRGISTLLSFPSFMSLRLHVRQAPTQRNWPIFFVVIVVEKLRGRWSIIFRKSNTATFRPWLKPF